MRPLKLFEATSWYETLSPNIGVGDVFHSSGNSQKFDVKVVSKPVSNTFLASIDPIDSSSGSRKYFIGYVTAENYDGSDVNYYAIYTLGDDGSVDSMMIPNGETVDTGIMQMISVAAQNNNDNQTNVKKDIYKK